MQKAGSCIYIYIYILFVGHLDLRLASFLRVFELLQKWDYIKLMVTNIFYYNLYISQGFGRERELKL